MSQLQTYYDWIKQQQGQIDLIIKDAAAYYYKHNNHHLTFNYELQQCYKESLNLMNGKDLCYDRPDVGLTYSLWYLGRRLNTMIALMAQKIYEASERKQAGIEIFDLGAGTGATQMAAAICWLSLHQQGMHCPRLAIHNVDLSPFMLHYNRDYLWKYFTKYYPKASQINPTYNVNSWLSEEEIQLNNPWFTASYLFDFSDNKEQLARDFIGLIKKYEAENIFLVTSRQRKKIDFSESITNQIIADQTYARFNPSLEQPYKGNMQHVGKARTSINTLTGTGFSKNPYWHEQSYHANVIHKQNLSIDLSFAKKVKTTGINLFTPPVVIRRDIILNDTQQKAAQLNGLPTIITGPAGCGKSVVISERIKNVVEKEGIPYDPKLRILVTTFNKDLMSYLGGWVADLLDSTKLVASNSQMIKFEGSEKANIRFMHLDILPTRLGGIRGTLAFQDQHKALIQQCIDHYKARHRIRPAEDQDILNPQYVYDEYHRVFYGQECKTKEEYLNATRKRRSPQLQKDSVRRNRLYDIIQLYLKALEKEKLESIYTRRRKFLNQLYEGQYTSQFSHLFVDEFQDCTDADYSIFYGLLKNNNNLVIAGDFAQAVQLGTTADIPRETESFRNTGIKMRNRSTKVLAGSYRLPARVSEAIYGLSKYIQEHIHDKTDLITPYKGAPPGARPIVIWGDDNNQIAANLFKVLERYTPYKAIDLKAKPPNRVSIMEKDYDLANIINASENGLAETDTILRIKGLEKLMVLFSTSAYIENSEDLYHFAYTICTRTASLLVITISPETKEHYYPVLSLLDREKLMFYNQRTEDEFDRMGTGKKTPLFIDEMQELNKLFEEDL